MEDKEFNEKYEQLKKSKFKQQKLWGWRPLPTISCITIIYISFAVFFILFGIIILVFTGQINEIKLSLDVPNNIICNKTTMKMKKPIMIYYELDYFSQNHRTYLDSIEKSVECDNILDVTAPAFPCGLIAKSFFYDNFDMWKINEDNGIVPIVKNIAYKSDKDKFESIKYGNTDSIMNNEQIMIWMRPSPFSNPRKLWGYIDRDLEKDDEICFHIIRNNNNHYGNGKYIILSNRNVFGGKSIFLGMCYIVFGILCLIASITFIIAFNSFHKKNSK